MRPRRVKFILNDKGRKKSVIMSYRTYLALIEDFSDFQTIAERKDEITVDMETIIAELKDAGRL